MTSYNPNNVFANPRGELPAYKPTTTKPFTFLDIMPRAPGHTLVIPKAPARNILDIDADALTDLIETTQTIARAAMKAFAANGLTVQQFNNRPAARCFSTSTFTSFRERSAWRVTRRRAEGRSAVLAEHTAKIADALKGA